MIDLARKSFKILHQCYDAEETYLHTKNRSVSFQKRQKCSAFIIFNRSGGGGDKYHMCYFWVPFFKQKIDFEVSILVKLQTDMNFWGVILERELFRISILIKFHVLGSNYGFFIILGYLF